MKGGTRYMATYAMGVLPGREGLTGCASRRRGRACMPVDLDEGRVELELGLRMAQEDGAAQ